MSTGSVKRDPDVQTGVPYVRFLSGLIHNREGFRSIVALFGSNVTSSLLGLLGGLLVARYIGPETMGLFRSFTIPMMYLSFLHLGTFDGLHRQIPYYVGKGMHEHVEVLASSAGAWNICVAIVVSTGFLFYSVHSLSQHDSLAFIGWLSQAIFAFGVFYTGYLAATYRTINQFVKIARIQIVQASLSFVAVFLVPIMGFNGLCLRLVSPSLLGVWLYHKFRPLKVTYRIDGKALSEVIRTGMPLSFWGTLDTSIWAATENALLLYLGGITGLGLFSVAVAIRDGMNLLPQAVSQVVSPKVVEAFGRDGRLRNANARLVALAGGMTGIMLVLAFLLSYLLDLLVPLAIPKYIEGLTLMKTCLWFSVVQAASLPLNTLFASGRSWLYGRGVIAGFIVFLLSTFLLIPHVGPILAVALGSLFGRFVRVSAAYADVVILTRNEVR